MYGKILLPTDGSALSAQAAAAAIELARRCGAELVAFSVAEPFPSAPMPDGGVFIDPGIDDATLRDIAQGRVRQVADAARAAGVACTNAVALSPQPHEEIVRAAARHGCDLIFMAARKRHGLARLLGGSVTDHVVHGAGVPVLVFHPPGAPPGA